MYEIRTDLALEAHEINAQAGREDGIRTEEETIDGFLVTTVHVSEGEGERLAKKKAGTYINVDVGKSWLLASEGFAALVALLAGHHRRLHRTESSGKGRGHASSAHAEPTALQIGGVWGPLCIRTRRIGPDRDGKCRNCA